MRWPFLLKTSVACVLAFVLMSRAAAAQSAIAGTVKDPTGAVLPGVTVEAASPALIEKTRSVLTDGAGEYKILDLRPGTYTVTFTLQGFNSVARQGIELPANFTAPVNAELRVGNIEETLTVSGQTPIVDIQSTTRRDALNRDLIDALPTGRNFQTAGAIMPSVSMGKLDIGGSTAMQTGNALMAAGSQQGDTTEEVDGMGINSTLSTGSNVPVYMNDEAYEEHVYTIVGGGADAQTPGVKINLIPKTGGNEFHGSGFAIFANNSFQAANISDAERARQGVSAAARLDKVWDYSGSLGGRIIRDKLWFFESVRNWGYNNLAPNAFLPNGQQAVDDNLLQAYNNRLTWQVNPKNKFTVMYDKFPKWRGHRNIETGTFEPIATVVQTVPLAYNAQAKWTSPVTNKLLLESGFSMNYYNYWLNPQAGLAPGPTNPLGVISQVDLNNSNRTYSATRQGSDQWFAHYYHVSSATWVSGSHALKVGEQYGWGWINTYFFTNGDLYEQFRGVPGAGGVPVNVVVSNTPVYGRVLLNADLGLYAQDTWTLKRLTLNPGIRFDYLNESIPAQDSPAGRFVPARHFNAINDLPNWSNWSPRLGAVYDLFGDSKTAIKGSVGKYVQRDATSFASKYNPLGVSTDTRTWNGAVDALGEPIDLGPSSNASFGISVDQHPAPGIQRPFQIVYNIGATRELWPRTAISANWYRREYHQNIATRNTVVPLSAYTEIDIPDPRNTGQTLPIYNLTGAPLGQLSRNLEDHNSPNNTRTYTGYDVTMSSRLPNGATINGGVSIGHLISSVCDVANPNGDGTGLNGLRFCDQTQYNIPWYPVFKVNGMYPLPYDFRFSGVLQSTIGFGTVDASFGGHDIGTTYLVTKTQVPTLVQPQVVVLLDPPGEYSYPRNTVLDLGIARTFKYHAVRLVPELDVFNVMNVNTVQSLVTTYGPNGMQLSTGQWLGFSTTNLTGRLARLQLQVHW
jgi:hypothetical protein